MSFVGDDLCYLLLSQGNPIVNTFELFKNNLIGDNNKQNQPWGGDISNDIVHGELMIELRDS